MTSADFSKLVDNSSRRLYIFAFRILRNVEMSEDAVQEVFLKLWKMRNDLKDYNSIDALTTTMIKNQCLDMLRKQKLSGQKGQEFLTNMQSVEPSPQEILEANETVSIVGMIIGNLPRHYANLIKMKDIEGRSYEEISESTGLSVNLLRVNLSRARKLLKTGFLKYNEEHGKNKDSA